MKISTKTRYAVRALIDMAFKNKSGRTQIKELAASQKLSIRYLENIFTVLRQKGILHSDKGKGGGFSFAQKPSKIKLLDIMSALGENLSLVDCVENPSECKHAKECVTRAIWGKLSSDMTKTLANITLQDLIDQTKNAVKK